MYGLSLLKTCEACGFLCERTFTDSWTGVEVCPECLAAVIDRVNLDCQTGERKDDFKKLLREHVDGPLSIDTVISCSSCGEEFLVPGREDGYSHCDQHAKRKALA